jgi:hypothetical protein
MIFCVSVHIVLKMLDHAGAKWRIHIKTKIASFALPISRDGPDKVTKRLSKCAVRHLVGSKDYIVQMLNTCDKLLFLVHKGVLCNNQPIVSILLGNTTRNRCRRSSFLLAAQNSYETALAELQLVKLRNAFSVKLALFKRSASIEQERRTRYPSTGALYFYMPATTN